MDEHAMGASGSSRLSHTGLPISEIGGEVVDGEGGGLFVGPAIGDGPEHAGVGGCFLGECCPLGVPHHAAASTLFYSCEFSPNNHGRGWSSGIASFCSHDIGEVQTSRRDAHKGLTGFYGRLREFLDGESIRSG